MADGALQEAAQLANAGVGEAARGRVPVLRQHLGQARLAELLVAAVVGLDEAVGVQEQAVARGQLLDRKSVV